MFTKRFAMWVAVVAFGTVCGAQVVPAQEWGKERMSHVQSSLVRIINMAPDGAEILRGNGFLISPDGLLLTNFHLIEKAARLQVYLAGGDVYDHIVVKALDSEADLALLRIPAFKAPFIKMASPGAPSVGNAVFVAPRGTGGQDQALRSGKVIAHHRLASGVTLVSTNLQWDALTRGMPVFDPAEECVGITTLGYEAEVGPGIFVDAGRLADLFSQKIDVPLEAITWDLFESKKEEAVRDSLRALGLRRRFPNPAIRTEKELVRRLEWSLEFDPTDLTTKELLARAYLHEKRWDATFKQVTEILSRDPASLPALTMKGDVFYYQGDFDAARTIYREIVAQGFQAPHHYHADFKGVQLPDFYHDHTIAGCSGPLILSTEKITFLPIGWSNDQVTVPYTSIRRIQVKTISLSGRPAYELDLKFIGPVSNKDKNWSKDEFHLRSSGKETIDALISYLRKRGVEVMVDEKR